MTNNNKLDNTPEAFIALWQGVSASELSTSQSFIINLCELLDVPRPHATPAQEYMFERPVTFSYADGTSSAGRVDCYRRVGRDSDGIRRFSPQAVVSIDKSAWNSLISRGTLTRPER